MGGWGKFGKGKTKGNGKPLEHNIGQKMKNTIHADGCQCMNGRAQKGNMGTMGIGTASMQKHNTTATPTVSFINESIHVIHRHLGT